MINTDVIEKVNAQFRLLISQIEDKEAENKRLRALAEDAYYEGNDDAVHGYGRDWLGSDARAALQPKEETK